MDEKTFGWEMEEENLEETFASLFLSGEELEEESPMVEAATQFIGSCRQTHQHSVKPSPPIANVSPISPGLPYNP
ncbi:hypothetical protein HAX54_036164 [Datura stramonium]|uniref:Uncharacterized protein n=1 Tax=Datura stramonium TaxID=4076 RepID=A0ABS8VJ55_DATST|nr:hypothetical protein [Datura stramonium]